MASSPGPARNGMDDINDHHGGGERSAAGYGDHHGNHGSAGDQDARYDEDDNASNPPQVC